MMKKAKKSTYFLLAFLATASLAGGVGALATSVDTAADGEVFSNTEIVMRDGASVRYNLNVTGEEAYNENGIRFTAFIPTATYNSLEKLEETDGVQVSYGMLIAPYSYYGTYGEFTEATVFGKNGTKKYTWTGDTAQAENATQIVNITYDDLQASKVEGKEAYHEINGSLKKIHENNIDREFVARGYICYTNGETVEYKFADYTGGDKMNNVRSIAYVAQKAIEANEVSKDWLATNYVSKVAGKATTYTVATYVDDTLVKVDPFTSTVNATLSDVTVEEYQGFTKVSAETTGTVYANGKTVLKHYYTKNNDSEYQIKNGGFEEGLENWTLTGTIGAVSSETHYWKKENEGKGSPFGLDGTYMFSAYDLQGENTWEVNKGVLKSSTFTVSESGWITYKLGGAKNSTYVHVDVVEAATGNILKRYYNQNHRYEVVDNVHLGCELNAYKANLSDCIGKEVYLRISDYASGDFGLFFLDSVDTLYLAEPKGDYTLATEVEHEATIYDLYNGNFDKDMDGWTQTGDIGVINETERYWPNDKNLAYNNVGKFFSAYKKDGHSGDVLEGNKGTLTSSVFEVGGSGWITYRIGGVKNPDQVYMEVVDALTGVKYGHFYNQNIADCTLVEYKADLSEYIGKLVYINFVDNATGDYGLIFCDEFKTYYANAADVPEYNVAVNKVESIYNVMNGGFESGNLLGWKLVDGEVPGFITDENYYWKDANLEGSRKFNKDGTFLFTGVETMNHGVMEIQRGTLRSNTFILKANSSFKFKMGGGINNDQIYIRLVKADGTEVARYYNNSSDAFEGKLVQYDVDINNAEDMVCYVEVVDNAESNWGLICLDSVSVYQK
ncbi:MAG: hypothetical protein E7357_07140 [Clostridiales bacterium]|nr:hypothetical protein [Clostridiales bacterium]